MARLILALRPKKLHTFFFNNLESVTFTTEDGSVIAIADCEITNYGGYVVATLGELKLTIMVDPLWKFIASENGTFNLTLREEVVHKIPEKYLPDGIGGGFTTVRFADFYDEEAEKDHVICSYTFEEVKDMSVTPNPKLYQLADAVGNEFGFCTMYAICTKIEDVEYIVLIDISLNAKQMHLFGNNGVYLYSEVFEGKMFDIDEAIEYGTITWGVSE